MRLGLLTNPRSRQNRRDPALAGRLASLAGPDAVVCEPHDLPSLDAAVARLAGVERLLVHGGDGTLHRVMTSFRRQARAMPPITLLRGGTMNIVADSVGHRLGAEATVIAAREGRVMTRQRRSPLRVEAHETLWGFLAGSGIISRFLELYYARPDPTPAGAAWLLARGAASALVGGRLAEQLTRPFEGSLVVDGRAWPGQRWTAVAIGSVEQLGLGFRPFPGVSDELGRMHVVGVGSGLARLAAELPRVFLGRGVAGPGNRESNAQVVELVADGPIALMVDGDFASGVDRVRISVDEPVDFDVA